MMKLIAAMLALFLLTGCFGSPKSPEFATDQNVRRQVFKDCMASLPEGPRQTTYNDWDEVVKACAEAAYYQAKVCVANCPVVAGGEG
jgi:hypothetical protein